MEYKDSDECNTEKSKAICQPDEKDDSCEEAFKDAVKKLLNVKESESIDYFDHLETMLENKKFKIDSSSFVSSGVVETLVKILFENTSDIHSKALSLLRTLSNYKDVAQFLNQEKIINYLINFALDFNNSMEDICYDFYILKKIVPFLTDENVVNSFPVEEFSGLDLRTAPITFFTELLIHHPDSILFDRIILYFNRYTPFISRTVHLAETFLKAVIPKHPEKNYA
ncbi:hypothetical protein TVAG_287790 [Trichomonas vaginalis G3]|uniref:Uncharacterized protein n=1 Tax=Trichomonas vaginalis (strain ATCC PRA-98 / G3) TaxID=412133 RepID=A2ER46_TRIV3|nr:armadillo (ARM) repeat-containing protein family [Trichomonas vaginalis G3]EAY04865.1 hypothetical protein TVAG_287790 [Trichomonas vaginalis G3]KAI5495305.1 armadillo (ARM) repeat-containing protein family [Trichomonas vaginalis G3]|eukprot:XP_001317088.1 hypothetical protein [Trichomonas vaginalis G3]